MVKANIIKFNRHYSKLSEDCFTTLRLDGKFKVGNVLTVKSPLHDNFKCMVLRKEQMFLGNVDDEFLIQDTDTNSREEAIKVLNECYKRELLNGEIITIYTIHKMDKK